MSQEKSVSEQLEEIAARRAARRQGTADQDDELRELVRAQAIDAAEEMYGVVGKGINVVEVTPGGAIVIVKKPANATYRKFQDSKDSDEAACKALVKPCVVYPTPEDYTKILEEYPAVLMRLVKACARLVGFVEEK